MKESLAWESWCLDDSVEERLSAFELDTLPCLALPAPAGRMPSQILHAE